MRYGHTAGHSTTGAVIYEYSVILMRSSSLMALIRGLWRFPLGGPWRRSRWGHVLVCLLSVALGWDLLLHNVAERLSATPLAAFVYPLDIDVISTVDRVLNRKVLPGMLEPLNKPGAAFTLNPTGRCQSRGSDGEGAGGPDGSHGGGGVGLLLLVLSRVGHVARRQAIRDTWSLEEGQWAGANKPTDLMVRTVFLIGGSGAASDLRRHNDAADDDDDTEPLLQESRLHRDIVHRDIPEGLRSGADLLLMGLQWTSQHCEAARFIGFVDDSDYVNQRLVATRLTSLPANAYRDTLIGFALKRVEANRDPASDRYISLAEYPFRYFPAYPATASFFLHRQAAQRMFVAAWFTRTMRFGDVYVGILAKRLGMRIAHWEGMHPTWRPCEPRLFTQVATMHNFQDSSAMKRCWLEQMSFRKP